MDGCPNAHATILIENVKIKFFIVARYDLIFGSASQFGLMICRPTENKSKVIKGL